MVRYKVRVEILSKEDMKDIERETVTLERTAKRQSTAKEKLGKSRKKRGGIFAGENPKDTLPSALIKRREKAELSRAEESKELKKQKGAIATELSKETFINKLMFKTGLKKAVKSKQLAAGLAPIQNQSAFKKLTLQVAKQQKAMALMQKGMGGFGLASGVMRGGAGGLMGRGLALASKFFPVAVAIAIGKTALQIWMDSYGAGGVNDPRKRILDDIKSFIGIERETDILSGKQFFANSRTLKAGLEIRSNTENLRDGHARTSLLRSPYNR